MGLIFIRASTSSFRMGLVPTYYLIGECIPKFKFFSQWHFDWLVTKKICWNLDIYQIDVFPFKIDVSLLSLFHMGRTKEVENLNSSEVTCPEDAQFLAFVRHGE